MKKETRNWMVEKIQSHSAVEGVSLIDEQIVLIRRKKYEPFKAILIADTYVEPESFTHILGERDDIDFVVNLPTQAVWDGRAIRVAEAHGLGWGGLRDLFSVINDEHVRGYQNREFRFVERGLRQHSRVSELKRVSDRVYDIERNFLPPVRVVLINEYELTAEHVRTTRENYGQFDAILKTNPNGVITSNAREVAKNLGTDIFNWGDFLSRLHKE